MILIFGSSGMLGNYMHTYLEKIYEVKGITRTIFDVYNLFVETKLKPELEKIICEFKPTHVINCIGDITKQYSTETPVKKYVINSYFPILLSMICRDNNIIMFHPTTDCVYSGKDSFYHDEFPDCVDDYGLSKFLGENIDACVIRVSIIGEEKYTSRSLINWVKSNKNGTVNGYLNHLWNGITCLEYAKFIDTLIENKTHWIGIKTLSSTFKGNNFLSKYELVKAISDIYNLNITVVSFETDKKCDRTLKGDIVLERDLYDQIHDLSKFIL